MSEFWQGARTLFRGFGWWRASPGLMALGLVPAAIVALLGATALVIWGASLPGLVEHLTPWAQDWAAWAAVIVRIAIGAALFGGGVVLLVFTFTALTLMVGEPFYQRIWKDVEAKRLGAVPDARYSAWTSIGDALVLLLKGIGIALLTMLLGLVPVLGGFAAAVLGTVLGGLVLADELTSRAFTARGFEAGDRTRLRRRFRGRTLGFGVATSLCFLVPLGAVLTMPAAVVGSTLLVQDMLGRAPDPRGTAA
ncbi:EI24 domain-containing protein [Gulosibacter sp. 10]|uniref:EI24 domain-containing protein n=1 Tax=Gulosibacter sp. 10 TaxID=1255570 RepID=UPI00097F1BBB|nr:EI24 domain-containing protein [Gulosibacter sp. 10]SJM61692.1 Sulfate transport system protein cysZ [Gulosibacter sp. 10]